MSVEIVNLYGDPNIGLFMVATDSYVIVSDGITEKFRKLLARILKVDVITVSSDTKLLGALISANDNGLVASHIIQDTTLEEIKKQLPDLNIGKIRTGYFAMGNLMVTNNDKTLISPIVNTTERKMVGDILGTEITTLRLAESDLIGSLLKITKLGGVISPIVENSPSGESEMEYIEDLLKVTIEPTTVNRGSQFPAGGIIANSQGVLIGNLTTGLETIAITKGLFP